ncbi:MAG: hypothetical protein ACTHLE_12425 [Agriterribacter sp.]
MWTLSTILTFAFLALSFDNHSYETNQHWLNKEAKHCKTEIDSLTKKTIYVKADKEAINAGGQIALMQQYEKITSDSIRNDFDTKFIIAFIVETDGQITGERIIKDKMGNVGQQMIKIAKSFKWAPAECDGQKVPMLIKLPLQICLQEN